MTMIVERWVPIPGFSGVYEVSDLGQVRSLKGRHGKGTVLKPALPSKGRQYKCVSLHKNGRRTRRSIHCLVLNAFVGSKPSPAHQARRLDGNRANNSADNLCWGTAKENARDRASHDRTAMGERHHSAKLTIETVAIIAKSDLPTAALASFFGVGYTAIQRIRNGKSWSAALKARQAMKDAA